MRTPQLPIGSGFGPASTAMDVVAGIDLSGRTAIVTGGYSGLGLEAVRALAHAGARVIVPARDASRAHLATDAIDGVEIDVLDLLVPSSIDAFADRFLQSGRALDILINNAGIMATPLTRDSRGFEAQFATNHLGHFQLTARLWPALLKAGSARVVTVSSAGHRFSSVDFSDVNFDRRAYDKWIAYGQAKTANVLFTVALDKVGESHGIRAFSLHPGIVLSPLARHLSEAEIASFNVRTASGEVIIDPERGLKTPAQGAATAVWCSTSPALNGMGGVYCANCDIAHINTGGDTSGVNAWAVDEAAAECLWKLSEQMAEATSRKQSRFM